MGFHGTMFLILVMGCSNANEENAKRCKATWNAYCDRLFACDPAGGTDGWAEDCAERTLATSCEDALAKRWPHCGGDCP